ncbi:hypothetical protein E2C01_071609 [Portunus trituberculatus]|uniref:Uncharacterized protein n=1 Tax=Portunus trituberculatus TaxID=210409 RepID=A0A5B7HVT1_PORTR|nr:hypothetical protein [Portunus trituberculatus]
MFCCTCGTHCLMMAKRWAGVMEGRRRRPSQPPQSGSKKERFRRAQWPQRGASTGSRKWC